MRFVDADKVIPELQGVPAEKRDALVEGARETMLGPLKPGLSWSMLLIPFTVILGLIFNHYVELPVIVNVVLLPAFPVALWYMRRSHLKAISPAVLRLVAEARLSPSET